MTEFGLHGAALVEQVIARVVDYGWRTRDALRVTNPRPVPEEIIAQLRFPGGRQLPPSLRRWLACPAESPLASANWEAAQPGLEGQRLSALVDEMYGGYGGTSYGRAFAGFETLLPGSCFGLCCHGSDSRRLLYVGEPDSVGEYPVLVTDVDDAPYVAVMYPGLDVYLADLAGLFDWSFGSYTELKDHPVYGARMREHVELTRLGPNGLEEYMLKARVARFQVDPRDPRGSLSGGHGG